MTIAFIFDTFNLKNEMANAKSKTATCDVTKNYHSAIAKLLLIDWQKMRILPKLCERLSFILKAFVFAKNFADKTIGIMTWISSLQKDQRLIEIL